MIPGGSAVSACRKSKVESVCVCVCLCVVVRSCANLRGTVEILLKFDGLVCQLSR